MPTYLGLDIGGTKIACALVSETGEVLQFAERPTLARFGRDAILQTAIDLADELLSVSANVQAIGIGSGGQIDSKRGLVVSATDVLPGWTGTRLAGIFWQRFRLPVKVDNDVNALASGELVFGAAQNAQTAVFVALGTGVGGALVIGAKLHRGATHTGGEIGHLILNPAPDARLDAGGARGTLEAYCSGSGLARTYQDLGGDPTIDSREIGRRALEADPLAAQAVATTGEWLGLGLASVANIIDPELILIGGGLAALDDLLLAPARRILAERALPGPSRCPIKRAALGEHASVIGAASLAIGTHPSLRATFPVGKEI